MESAGVAGIGVVYGKGLSDEGIEDRAYRLYHNAGQQRTDRFAWVRLQQYYAVVQIHDGKIRCLLALHMTQQHAACGS